MSFSKKDIETYFKDIAESRFSVVKKDNYLNTITFLDKQSALDSNTQHFSISKLYEFILENDLQTRHVSNQFFKFDFENQLPKNHKPCFSHLSSDYTSYHKHYVRINRIETNLDEIVDFAWNKWGKDQFFGIDYALRDIEYIIEDKFYFNTYSRTIESGGNVFDTKLFDYFNESITIIEKYDYLNIYEKLSDKKILVIPSKFIDTSKTSVVNFTRLSSRSLKDQQIQLTDIYNSFSEKYKSNFYKIVLLGKVRAKNLQKRKTAAPNYGKYTQGFSKLHKKIIILNLFYYKNNTIPLHYKKLRNVSLDFDPFYINSANFVSKNLTVENFLKKEITTFIKNYDYYKKIKYGKEVIKEIKKLLNKFVNTIEADKDNYYFEKDYLYDRDVKRYERLFLFYNIDHFKTLAKCKFR